MQTIFIPVFCDYINDNVIIGIFLKSEKHTLFRRDLLDVLDRLDTSFIEMPVGIIASKTDGTLLSTNNEAITLLGFSKKAELMAFRSDELYFDKNERLRLIEDLRTNPVKNRIIKLKKKDNSWFWASLSSTLSKGVDKDTILTVFKDITKEQESLEKISGSEEKLKIAEQVAGTGYYERVLDTYEIHISDGLYKLAGYEPGSIEITYNNEGEFFNKDDLEKVEKCIEKSLENNSEEKCEARLLTKSGEEKYCHFYWKPIANQEGKVYKIISVIKDISNEKKAIIQISESEERLKIAEKMAQTGYFEIFLESNEMLISNGLYSLIGYKPGSIELTLSNAWSFFHKNDVQKMNKIINSALVNKKKKNCEARIITKSGKIKHCQFQIQPIAGPNEVIYKVLIVISDITSRIKNENTLIKLSQKLQTALIGTINVLGRAIEAKDAYTSGHQNKVSIISVLVAKQLNLSSSDTEEIQYGALIHDIGKIAIPAEILSKPSKLTYLEYEIIKTHPENGYSLLSDVEFPWKVSEMILNHHERLDGSGYPNGLKGDAISFGAQIIGIVDVFEAMSSHRPYRAALGIDAAIKELSDKSGSLYNKEIVGALEYLVKNKRKLIESIINT